MKNMLKKIIQACIDGFLEIVSALLQIFLICLVIAVVFSLILVWTVNFPLWTQIPLSVLGIIIVSVIVGWEE